MSTIVPNPPLLQLQKVRKVFPGVLALDDVDFSARRGEIHAIMGENGAGKSTLIKVLTGAYPRDGGRMLLDGAEIAPRSPQEAQRLGISTVYQEVNLIPSLSVAENIFLGRQPTRWGRIDWRQIRRRSQAALERLDLSIDVNRQLSSYSIAIQQMVAIARAIDISARLLILDEPTSSLDANEVQRLFAVMRKLRDEGMAIIFVSHFLDQVYAVTDRITILRNGRLIGEYPTAQLSRQDLIARMMGRELADLDVQLQQEKTGHHPQATLERDIIGSVGLAPSSGTPGRPGGPSLGTPTSSSASSNEPTGTSAFRPPSPALPRNTGGGSDEPAPGLSGTQSLLRARGLGRTGSIQPFDLEIGAGEIIGLAGLLGSGRSEMARLLFGIDVADIGDIEIDNKKLVFRHPRQAIALGLAFCPEDRKTSGIIPELSIRENIVLALQARGGLFKSLSRARQDEIASGYIKALGIVTPSSEQSIANLSGGNQQKAILARWLAAEPRLLILDEPTRGIDVGAKAEIQKLVLSLCRQGTAIIFISSELEEVVRVSDRVLVLRDRAIVGQLKGAAISEQAIMQTIAGDGPAEVAQ